MRKQITKNILGSFLSKVKTTSAWMIIFMLIGTFSASAVQTTGQYTSAQVATLKTDLAAGTYDIYELTTSGGAYAIAAGSSAGYFTIGGTKTNVTIRAAAGLASKPIMKMTTTATSNGAVFSTAIASLTLTFSGIEFDGANTGSTGQPMLLQATGASNNIYVSNCTIQKFLNVPGNGAIRIDGLGSSLDVQGTTINNCGGRVLYFNPASATTGSINLKNNTISNCTTVLATSRCNMIYWAAVTSGTTTIDHCTFYNDGNSAATAADGVVRTASGSGAITITNTIFSNVVSNLPTAATENYCFLDGLLYTLTGTKPTGTNTFGTAPSYTNTATNDFTLTNRSSFVGSDGLTAGNSSIYPALVALTAPTVGTGSGQTSSGFTANWTKVSNAISYDVAVYQGASLISTTNASGQATQSLSITGLVSNTTYTYKVTAKGDGIVYSPSPASIASDGILTLGLAVPTVGTASTISASGFTANWTAVANATGYDVKVYLGTSLVSTTNVSGQATASVAITGLAAGTTYTYKVVAKGDGSAYVDSTPSAASTSFTTTAEAVATINTNLADGTWGSIIPSPTTNLPASGSYPTSSVNGFTLTKALLYGGTSTGLQGEYHIGSVRLDKGTLGSMLTLPTLNSISQMEIHVVGTSPKQFVVRQYNTGTSAWDITVGTYTLTGAEDIFYIPVNGTNATFRIENEATSTSSLAIYQITTRTTNPVSVLGTPYAPNTATAITGSGFNASWNTVPNASGYLVRTYSTLGTLRNTFAVSGGSTTSYAVTGIDTVKVGTYKVVATGDYITYSNSNISPASTPYAITRLATPVIGVGSGATASGFTANWSTVVNASSYDVLVYQGATLISTTNAAGEATITVDITGLSEYTPYTYTVIAKGDGATYFDSYPSTASASISTLRNLPKVATPAIGTASSVLATGFTANWTVVDNAASYNISVYQGVTFIKTVNASGQATASVAITGLTAGLAYTYKMVAVGDGATYDDSVVSDASAIVTTNILATPTIGTASAVTATGFTANWTAVADASSYSVILYSGINAIDTKSAVGQSIQSIDFTGLTSGFSYTYKVQAIGDGTTYASSGVSTASASVTTNKLIAPAIGTVSDINATGFTANWTAVANAVSYDVKVYNSGATLISTTNITGEASNSLAITGLSNFTIYNYKVTAIGDVNYANSDISSVSANFITLDPAAVNTISTNFNDGTWGTPLASVPTVSGTFGSSTVNGFTLTNTCLTESSAKGPKGESHTNRISFDKQNTGAMVTLPTLNSVSQIEIHATSGSAGNGFFLQEYVPSSNSWVAVGANYVYELASKNSGLDSIYIIPISRNVQTKFRIGNFASGSLNLYQVITRTTNPALLARPTVNAASGITGSGFTASWIPVTYATGYKVKVYKSSTAGVASSTVRNTYTVSGQATSSYAVVNADTALNALTYKVQAIGNADVDYSDSYNSSASAGFYISKSATTIAIGNEVDASTLGGTSANQDVTIPGTSTLTTVSAPVTVNTVTFEAGAKLNLTNALTVAGDLTFKSDNSSSFSANLGTSHITVTGNVSYVKYMDDMTWYFMAFPVPMVVANIKDAVTGTPLSASGELIIKYYDSALRSSAGATGTNWITVATGATLEAKKGYIFGIKGISKGGLANNYNVKFPLPSTIVSAGETDGATVPVEAYTGGAADNNGWNLIGQPFLSTYSGADATGAGVGLNYLNIPDATGATYSQTAKGAAMINPFQAYFVQATGAGDISFGTNGRQGVKSTVETDLSEQVQINFTSATGTDKTNLIMDNNQSTAYEIGQDLAKMLGTGTAKPQIYSILGDVNYAYNALPMSSVSNLPIGVYTQTAGTTTISADATLAPSLSSLILLDNSNGLSYDLLEGSFSFEAIAGYSSTTRFSITAQRVATENLIQSVNDGLNLISVNGKLMLNNNAGTTTIRVFDAIGRMVANKTSNSNSLEIPLVAKGMYTIQVESGAKIWTKKIVNQ